MKVLIVAKTRHGSGACIGGITLAEGRSVRLVAADAAFNEHAGLEYKVGEIWEVDGDSRRAGDPAPRREHHRPVEVPTGADDRSHPVHRDPHAATSPAILTSSTMGWRRPHAPAPSTSPSAPASRPSAQRSGAPINRSK